MFLLSYLKGKKGSEYKKQLLQPNKNESRSTATILLLQADKLIKAGEYSLAKEIILKAIAMDPQHPYASALNDRVEELLPQRVDDHTNKSFALKPAVHEDEPQQSSVSLIQEESGEYQNSETAFALSKDEASFPPEAVIEQEEQLESDQFNDNKTPFVNEAPSYTVNFVEQNLGKSKFVQSFPFVSTANQFKETLLSAASVNHNFHHPDLNGLSGAEKAILLSQLADEEAEKKNELTGEPQQTASARNKSVVEKEIVLSRIADDKTTKKNGSVEKTEFGTRAKNEAVKKDSPNISVHDLDSHLDTAWEMQKRGNYESALEEMARAFKVTRSLKH